jgi:putative hydrolase of the HAD superfamily
VISNWEGWLEPLMLHLEIHVFFDAHTISGHHGIEKPDPRLFQIALDSLGVRADQAAHVGDSLSADVVGARQAGLRAVWIDRSGRTEAPPPADYSRITDLRQLPAILSLGASAGACAD